jgi:thiosulfate/3-mercaptopyruvate sulfurtransferase
MFTALVEREVLEQNLGRYGLVVVDCRFSLADTEAGQQAYEKGHIPGAVYAHLDDDLCGPPITDHGRHPLPTPEAMAAKFGRMGIDGTTQVVVYDDTNGAIASRLWWMLRYMGHEAAAVLNGGWQVWQEARFPVRSGVELNEAARFVGAAREDWLVTLNDLGSVTLLVDSRAPERYRGEIEPIDIRAGHIPGAVNFFYQLNWDGNGRYFPPDLLKERLEQFLGETPEKDVTFHCGSGVTACANLLAMAYAGLGDGKLYVGSWSEWCRDPSRPAVKGKDGTVG